MSPSWLDPSSAIWGLRLIVPISRFNTVSSIPFTFSSSTTLAVQNTLAQTCVASVSRVSLLAHPLHSSTPASTNTMATSATPELEPQQSPPTNGLKRRQSEVSEQENKRLRTSPGKTSPDPETSRARDAPSEDRSRRESTKGEQAQEPRRKSSAVNEKDRSRRLFGGLLGSLSQKGDNRTTKRRQEIESRKKAELQRQDDEHVEDKQKRLEQLSEKRRRVKREMQEETVCLGLRSGG